jgi:DNA repair protein RadC
MILYEYRTTRRKVAELPQIYGAGDVARIAGQVLLADRETEALAVLLLNTKNRPMGIVTLYEGNVSAGLVRMAELFRDAVRMNAPAIVIVHNHPSGDPTPSPDDWALTRRAVEAGRLLDIDVLDHVIIAEGGAWRSLREADRSIFPR